MGGGRSACSELEIDIAVSPPRPSWKLGRTRVIELSAAVVIKYFEFVRPCGFAARTSGPVSWYPGCVLSQGGLHFDIKLAPLFAIARPQDRCSFVGVSLEI